MNFMLLTFKGIKWDITYYSDIDEYYIESITVNGGDEMIDNLTERFVAELFVALGKYLEKDAGQERSFNYG